MILTTTSKPSKNFLGSNKRHNVFRTRSKTTRPPARSLSVGAIEKQPTFADSEQQLIPSINYRLKAKRLNKIAKVVYVLLVLAFNFIFWIVAIIEYLKPAVEYL